MSKIDNSKYKWISTHMTNKNGTVEFTGYIQVLNTIEEKFNKFLATKRANSFVNDIPYLGIDNLLKKYDLQYLYKCNVSKSRVMAYIRLKTANIRGIRDYTHLPKQEYKTVFHKSLTKEEIKKIWSAKENLKLGYAERMRMLEEHKIDRWEKAHKPTYEQLKNDLFPRSIISAFVDKMEKKREEIRSSLAEKYPDPSNKLVKLRFYQHKGIVESICEKTIGFIRDPLHIIDKRLGYYYMRDSSDDNIRKVFDQIKNMSIRFRNIYKDNFICLKIMYNNDRVGCWA